MTAMELLKKLRRAGVILSADGDRLLYDAPSELVTPELLKTLKARKQELLAILSGKDRPSDVPGIVWDRRGVRLANPPDPRATCLKMAEARGWPPLAIDGTADLMTPQTWRVFTADAPLPDVLNAIEQLEKAQ